VVAGLTVGCFLTWNVSNVGAAAEPLAAAYGTTLAVVGLLTAALFVTHLASQLPAGIWSDRVGPHRVALVACAAAAAGNAILLIDSSIGLALAGRLVVGIGSGAGFVAGLDLVRAGGGGSVLRGLYGGATMAGGGLALLVLPPLTEATGWRAPYATGLGLAVAAAAVDVGVRGLPRVGRGSRGVLRDTALLPLGALQVATFGLAVIAGSWIVPLLECGAPTPPRPAQSAASCCWPGSSRARSGVPCRSGTPEPAPASSASPSWRSPPVLWPSPPAARSGCRGSGRSRSVSRQASPSP